MGILGYPNMDDNNRDGGFGDYSDIYANFADEENNVTNDETAYTDSTNTHVDENSVSQAGIPDNTEEEFSDFQNRAPIRQGDNGRLSIYLVVLFLVLVSAVAMFFYKKNMATTENVVSEQEMGDYFYDKVSDTAQEPQVTTTQEDKIQNAETTMATIDVDLNTDTQTTVPSVKKAQAKTSKETAVNEEKPLTALEKAMAKKKADSKKENRVSLGNAVVIPVTSGGRSDPFLPYGVAAAGALKPKFDLVAPPLVIPETDPMTEKMLEFKLSGIMFDNIRPSAILSIDGTEQLVHKGDVVMGYKILNITRKSVLVKYGSNTYEVTTGQTINSEEKLNLNPVSSLSKQFGGAYSQSSKNVIQFNN